MKKTIYILYIICLSALFTVACRSQGLNFLKQQCPSPNSQIFSSFTLQQDGNINAVPCPSGNLQINGTNLIAGGVTGSGTINFVPRFTAASIIGNTPLSWDDSRYVFNNNNADADFLVEIIPTLGAGSFNVGDYNFAGLNFFILDASVGEVNVSANAAIKSLSALHSWNNKSGTISEFTMDLVPSTTVGTFRVGDYTATPTNYFELIQSTNTFTVEATTINTIGSSVILGTQALNGVNLNINNGIQTFTFNTNGNDGTVDFVAIQNFLLQRTITAGGTTGAQVINKPNGSVNFAIAATSLVVTNSIVSATSLINATAQANDATCYVKNVVAGVGSFTINMTAACTAETKVAFWVTN